MPDVDAVEVGVAACDQRGTIYRNYQRGSASFLVPQHWLETAIARLGADAPCLRVTAVSYALRCHPAQRKPSRRDPSDGCARLPPPDNGEPGAHYPEVFGRVVGSSSSEVLRGDRTLRLRAVRPAGEVPFAGRTRFAVQIGTFALTAEEPYGAAHTFVHVPDGVVTRVRATTPTAVPGIWAAGDIAPLVRLDETSGSASIDVPAAEAILTPDVYEWDDDASYVSRAALAAGGQEDHTAQAPNDVDNIPLTVVAGTRYRLTVQPTDRRPGELAVEVRDAAGVVRGGANRSPADFQPAPTVTFLAGTSGRWLATIKRNDREPVAFAYRVALSVETAP